jgi:hypothetical protein
MGLNQDAPTVPATGECFKERGTEMNLKPPLGIDQSLLICAPNGFAPCGLEVFQQKRSVHIGAVYSLSKLSESIR